MKSATITELRCKIISAQHGDVTCKEMSYRLINCATVIQIAPSHAKKVRRVLLNGLN